MVTIEFFSPPEGEFVKNPKLEWLKGLILNKGESYWNAGAGQGSLTRKQNGSNVQLTITLAPDHVFYLEYIDRDDTYFVSIGEGTFEETITVEVGGDPLLLPTAFLISKELACAAVVEFCKTGQRTKRVKWKKRSSVNWHYGFPEE